MYANFFQRKNAWLYKNEKYLSDVLQLKKYFLIDFIFLLVNKRVFLNEHINFFAVNSNLKLNLPTCIKSTAFFLLKTDFFEKRNFKYNQLKLYKKNYSLLY